MGIMHTFMECVMLLCGDESVIYSGEEKEVMQTGASVWAEVLMKNY